jgi:NifU-like domain
MKVFWCSGIIYSCAIFLPLLTTTQVSAFTTVLVISNNAMTRNGIARNLKNTLIHHSRSTNSPQNEDNNNIIGNFVETKKDVSTSSSPPPPSFNGKLVLPRKILQQGLKKKDNDENYQIAAVYALLTRQYSKATPGWEHVIRVGMTMDLAKELNQLNDQEDATAAFVRVRSYSIPQRLAMEELVQEWKQFVTGVTTETSKTTTTAQPLVDSDELLRRAKVNSLSAFDDDDNDDDDDDWQVSLPSTRSSILSSSTSASVMSPFADDAVAATTRNLPFTIESVNTVLEEVRPFLIADGGNVAVDRIDDTTQNVYLKLEGACGSCPRYVIKTVGL